MLHPCIQALSSGLSSLALQSWGKVRARNDSPVRFFGNTVHCKQFLYEILGSSFGPYSGSFFGAALATTIGTQNYETRQCVSSGWLPIVVAKADPKKEPKRKTKIGTCLECVSLVWSPLAVSKRDSKTESFRLPSNISIRFRMRFFFQQV